MCEKKKNNKNVISQLDANGKFSKNRRKSHSRYLCLTDLNIKSNNKYQILFLQKLGGMV